MKSLAIDKEEELEVHTESEDGAACFRIFLSWEPSDKFERIRVAWLQALAISTRMN